jgi:2-dehydropantoate 2-reductase
LPETLPGVVNATAGTGAVASAVEEGGAMRVAVMGSGGTGGFFGGLLARSGEDVTFLARGAHLDAIRARGLRIRSTRVGDFHVAASATDDPATVGAVDLVLFCVKAYDTEAAAERMRPLVGAHTIVLPVQNGIDGAERIGRVIGPDHVIGGLAAVSSVIESPGAIHHRAGPDVIGLGELHGPPSARVERVAEVLRRAGVKAEVRADIQVALWEKFVLICGLSGLTALTRLPLGAVLACAESRALLAGAMEEVEAVGRAEGVALPPGCARRTLAFFEGSDPAIRGSLYYDLAAGKRLEIDTLNGTVVRLGGARGVPTPLNFAIYAALKPYADGAPAGTAPP